jgi:hypothetical protein
MSKALRAAVCQAPTVLVVGYGDGSVANAIAENPQKDVVVLCLPGDPETCPLSRGRVARIASPPEIRQFVLAAFGAHPDIPPLGGVQIVDDHPVSVECTEARTRLLPDLRTALKDQPQLYGNDIIDSFMGLYHASLNAPRLLRAPFLGENFGAGGEVPVIAIGAGPSLRRHLDRLRDLQERAILVACDSAFPGLVAAGIVPHFVAPLERLRANAGFMAPAAGTRARFAGLPVCHPDALPPFGDALVGVAGYDRLYDWFWPDNQKRVMTGSSTGVLCVSLSLALTNGPVYLVGHDLATDGDESHWDAADLAKRQWKEARKSTVFGGGYEDRMIPGNNGQTVRSIAWWDRFRNEIGLLARSSKRAVYNVNAFHRTGAKIEDTLAGDLPEPDSLPLFLGPNLTPARADRYDTWKAKALQLPADGLSMVAAMRELRDDILRERKRPAHAWNVGAIVDRMSLTTGCGEDNGPAFGYALRSALFNNQALYHAELAQCTGPNRARWVTLDGVDSLCSSLIAAMAQLQPCLERIAREA